MSIYRGDGTTGVANTLFNTDGDKGDITVTSSGSVWTIDTGVVTTSKLGGDITAQGKALLDDTTASQQRTTLGLGTAAVTNSADYTTVANLAASTGSSLIGHIASGTGAVARTAQSKLKDVVSAFDFMTTAQIADVKAGTLLIDVTSALQSAITASISVYLPTGNYLISSALLLQRYSYIYGDGFSTIITSNTESQTIFSKDWAGTGFDLKDGDVSISDMTLFGKAALCTGISFSFQLNCNVFRVKFSGLNRNVYLNAGRYYTIKDCISVGNSYRNSGQMFFTCTDDTNYLFYPTLENYNVYTGIFDATVVKGSASPAIYARRTVAAAFNNCSADRLELVSRATFINFENDCQGCKVEGGGSHGSASGIVLSVGSGPAVAPSYIHISNHDIDTFGTNGISISGTSSASCVDIKITGGIISAPNGAIPCISISRAIRVLINEVIMDDYLVTALASGINMANTQSVQVKDCTLNGFAIGLGFIGTNNIGTQILGNEITNCTTPLVGDITNAGTGTMRVVENRGLNPQALTVTTPAIPATGVTVQNTTGTDVTVAITGGTNVTVGLNGYNTGITLSPSGVSTGGMYTLQANGSISLTYTVAPTWVWIPNN